MWEYWNRTNNFVTIYRQMNEILEHKGSKE